MDFPEELAAFRARTDDPGYQALILLGTKQATTAALLIGTLQLQRVAFLLTDDTQNMPQDVAAMLGCSTEGWLCPSGDHSTTVAVYRGLRGVLAKWADLAPNMIAADVTGGLKPMSLGLEKASHVLGLQTIYVQSDYEKLPDGKSRPIAGRQRLETPPDPYTVFGDLEAAEARRLYQAHDYAGAQRIFGDLATRLNEDVRYTALATLADMYAAWDVFDFEKARAQARLLLAQPLSMVDALADHQALLEQQHKLLQSLFDVSIAVVGRSVNATQTLATSDAVLPLLGSLHAAALRRAEQGRYDFAALFRYRCLELISQHRLATHGLLTNKPDFRHFGDSGGLNVGFKQVQASVGRADPRSTQKLRSIGLFDGYMLLAALDDPLVRGYSIKRIEDRSKARNTSVLAHGYRLIGESEYTSFAEVVDEVLTRLFNSVLKSDREAWERSCQFVQPFV